VEVGLTRARSESAPSPSHFSGLGRFEALEEINPYPSGPSARPDAAAARADGRPTI
jgi:hypothetical protein